MYHARFKGTHYEAGRRFGEALRTHGHVITGSPTFAITDGLDAFARECLPLYEKHFPEVVSELQGMADGQGTPFETLCGIVFNIYCVRPQNHCTCFALTDDAGGILFGRNSDFLVSLEKLNTNCLYRLDGSYAFNGNTTAFVQMEDGVNERGLAAGLTFIYPRVVKPGLNAGMLVRYILEKCETTAQAVDALKTLPIASEQTVTLADKTGDIAVVECNPEAFEIIRPERGRSFVASANNFVSQTMRSFRAPEYVDTWRADERYAVARAALEGNKDGCSVDFARGLLSGKYGFMCQYDRKNNADTVWSVIYDIKNGRVLRAEGNPSRRRFAEDARMAFSAGG